MNAQIKKIQKIQERQRLNCEILPNKKKLN